MGKRRRSFCQALKAFFRYLDEHSPAEVFGGLARRVARRIASVGARLRLLADPFVLSLVTGAALVAGGLALIGLSWRGAAAQINVALQMTYLVSGGFGGLALVLLGVGVLHIQGSRRAAARERAQMQRVAANAALLLEAASLVRRGRRP